MDQLNQNAGTPNTQGGQSQQGVNSKKLFVGNLSWSLKDEDLRQLFSKFGTVEDAVVLAERTTGRSKGFGFVTMSTEEEAQAAIEALHQTDVDGRSIVVNVAQPPRPREDRGFNRGGGGGYNKGGYNNDRRKPFRRDY